MRRVLLLLGTATATVALAWWLAGLPDDVTLRIGPLIIETRSGLALLGGALLSILLLLALRLVLAILNIPTRLRAWHAAGRRASGDVAVAEALVALAAADPQTARAAAARARARLGDTAQTLLLDAEANRLAGREADAAALYKRMQARPDAAFLGLRGLFRQALARENWTEAAALADRAAAARPGTAWLRDERLSLAVRIGDWSAATKLAPTDTSRTAFAVAAVEATVDPDHALSLAKRAWKSGPGFPPAALAYAARLRAAGREAKAQQILSQSWSRFPHPALADLALRPTTDKLARVAAATRLTAGVAQHPETHFLLARLTLDAGLIGEARRHLLAAQSAGLRQRRVHLLAADLEAAEHPATEAGQRAQRDALHAAATAEPDPAWHCDSCGTAHLAWHPACPACHAAIGLRWGSRKHLALT